MSRMYTLDGCIVDIDVYPPIFRKCIDFTSEHGRTELRIANMVRASNCSSLVRIYNVMPSFYDIEMLDVGYGDTSTLADNLRECLRALHSIGVIYLDFRRENVGYSRVDHRWKLFDFDLSGVIDLQHRDVWLCRPFMSQVESCICATDDELMYTFLKLCGA